MLISKIEVENLTVFEKMAMDVGANVNVIIGENGTGKTHLLKFIKLTLGGSVSISFSVEEQIEFRESIGRLASAEKVFGKHITVSREKENESTFKLFVKSELLAGYYLRKKVKSRTKEPYLREVWGSSEVFEGFVEKYDKIVFLPSKDMLTHSKGLVEMKDKYGHNMPFDLTLLDVIKKARRWKLDKMPKIAEEIIPKLEMAMDGKVVVENEEFFIQKNNGQKLSFSVESEGMKKIGLIWQLLMNESIAEGSVLLWDEPEANMNPKLIPVLAEIILELGRNGVQIFLATHDGLLAEYIEHLMSENDQVAFHALYKTDNGVQCETDEKFTLLSKNAIIAEKISLYKKIVEKGLE